MSTSLPSDECPQCGNPAAVNCDEPSFPLVDCPEYDEYMALKAEKEAQAQIDGQSDDEALDRAFNIDHRYRDRYNYPIENPAESW